MLKRDYLTVRSITGVIIRKLPLPTAATTSQRGMSSAALSKSEIEDLHKTGIEAATSIGTATATKEGSTQTDSGAARLELLAGRTQSRLLARPAFSCQNRLLTRAALSVPSVAEFTLDLADSFPTYATLFPQEIPAFPGKIEPGTDRLTFCLHLRSGHRPLGHYLLARLPGALSRL